MSVTNTTGQQLVSLNCNSSSNSSISSTNSNESSTSAAAAPASTIANTNTTTNASNTTTPLSNTTGAVKKSRPKTSSPTRHGPQQCQVCSKIFGNASALAKHKLTHSDERKYVCVMCSKAFKRQDHLNGHMLTHRNKKPYECKAEGCGKSYCDARSLRRHTENHHSSLALTATTPPQNQSLSPSTGPPTGLSLSPATASGDASSPHGATCIQYITNSGDSGGGISSGGTSSKPSSPNCSPTGSIGSTGSMTSVSLSSPSPSAASSPSSSISASSVSTTTTPLTSTPTSTTVASVGNEGLTKHQLDLISQIMQQTKQANAQVTLSKTNLNGLKNSQSSTQSSSTSTSTSTSSHQTLHQQQQQQPQRPRTWNMQTQLQQNQPKASQIIMEKNVSTIATTTIAANGTLSNLLVGGNSSHQLTSSVNQQILNIVKIENKPAECNLCHRKFKNTPALNGHMRLHGGYFKKDTETKKCEKKESTGPPLQTASIGVRALIEEKIINKRSKDLKGAFVVPAPPLTNTIRRPVSDLENFLTPKSPVTITATGIPSGTNNSNTTIANNNHGQSNSNIPPSLQLQKSNMHKVISVVGTTNQSTSTDNKDATLIELLKRGNKIAVKRTCSDPGQLFNTTNSRTQAVIKQITEPPSITTASTPTHPTPTPLSISLPNGETAPLALTISQTPNGSGDVYTLTYSTDSSSSFFGDSDVYSVSDATMLLQAVDSIQLLNDSNATTTTAHLEEITSINDYSLSDDVTTVVETLNANSLSQDYSSTPSKELQAVLNSPLPDNLAEFTSIHSKDFILYNNNNNNNNNNTINNKMTSPRRHNQRQQLSISPLPSPLAYPTPPASHEAVTQSSPFLDDSHHFADAAATSSFFDDKSNFIDEDAGEFFKTTTDDDNLTEDEKILKLKSVLEDSGEFFKNDNNTSDVFDVQVKVEDLLNEASTEQCDMKDFADQNLSFLDDAQSFLDESGNPTSPLTEAFFTSGIGTAEEVKEVLKDVLPNEGLVCDQPCENDIDLYYLPGLTLQSQMMPNSEDPLLSSSPRDFGHRVLLQQHQQTLIQQQQQQPIQLVKFESQAQVYNSQPKKMRSNENIPLMMTTTTTNNGTSQIHFTVQQTQKDDGTMVESYSIVQPPQSSSPSMDSSSATNATMTVGLVSNSNICTETLPDGTQTITFNANSTLNSHLQSSGIHLNLNDNGSTNSNVILSQSGQFYSNNNSEQQHQQQQLQPIMVPNPSPVQSSYQNLTQPMNTSILKRRLRQGGGCYSNTTGNINIFPKKQEVYRSKLRRPSTTHYTPSPLINPERKGTGLYSSLPKSLTHQDSIDLSDEFEDAASLVAFLDDSKVNIGTAYQASIPTLLDKATQEFNQDSITTNGNEEIMWDPCVTNDDILLNRYIELSKSSAVPLGAHTEEVALQALFETKGDTHLAVLNLLQAPSSPVYMKWTAEEIESFLKGLERNGKDFYSISKEMKSKSTGDCVQLYYFWKKICIDYKFTHLKQIPDLDEQNQSHSMLTQSTEPRPHVCEMPDCSASFTSKAALHGHTRIHCIGRNLGQLNTHTGAVNNFTAQPQTITATNQGLNNIKDDYPCKVCGK